MYFFFAVVSFFLADDLEIFLPDFDLSLERRFDDFFFDFQEDAFFAVFDLDLVAALAADVDVRDADFDLVLPLSSFST